MMSDSPQIVEAQSGDTISSEHGTQSNYRTIGERLSDYDVSLTNFAEDPGIQNAMASFGYTPERVAEGEALLTQARQADADQKREYGEQYAAYDRLQQEFKEASGPYTTSLKVARIAFKEDRKADTALLLSGRLSNSLPMWVQRCGIFYTNLLDSPHFCATMATFGRTRAMLEAEYKEFSDVADALAKHRREMGEAREATARRDECMEALDEWMSDFLDIARLAMPNQPESLKKLGL
jgi:hypothetical protein